MSQSSTQSQKSFTTTALKTISFVAFSAIATNAYADKVCTSDIVTNDNSISSVCLVDSGSADEMLLVTVNSSLVSYRLVKATPGLTETPSNPKTELGLYYEVSPTNSPDGKLKAEIQKTFITNNKTNKQELVDISGTANSVGFIATFSNAKAE